MLKQGSLFQEVKDLEKLLLGYRPTLQEQTSGRFNLMWSLNLGTTTNALGATGFSHPHNLFKGVGVCLVPYEDRSSSTKKKKAIWRACASLIQQIDPEYAAGDFAVAINCMTSKKHDVYLHRDESDVSWQYILTLGKYRGAHLECFNNAKQLIFSEGKPHRIVKFDGRLPHRVRLDDFRGTRISVIWYKCFDRCKEEPDPIFKIPKILMKW